MKAYYWMSFLAKHGGFLIVLKPDRKKRKELVTSGLKEDKWHGGFPFKNTEEFIKVMRLHFVPNFLDIEAIPKSMDIGPIHWLEHHKLTFQCIFKIPEHKGLYEIIIEVEDINLFH